MRRKPGSLLPLELAILELASARPEPFHGFEAAKVLAAASGSRGLTGHGTLYKALARLEGAGLLESEWEDPAAALDEGRPRRRLYRMTTTGVTRLAAARAETIPKNAARRPQPSLA